MKLIKSTLALAAALAVGAGAVQAATPVNFSLTAYVQPGNTINALTINNSIILTQIGTALHHSMAGLKLAAETDGDLIIIDGSGTPVYFLSSGENNEFNTSTAPGPNGATLSYYTDGYAYVQSGEQFFFFDPVWSGTETDTNLFNVKANAEGGFFEIFYGYDSYVHNSVTGHTTNLKHVENELEISDGSKATVACKLAAGTYTQSFTIWASGFFFSTANGDGTLVGTVTCSGTQVGGSTFLDPFNGFGNYDTDFEF